MTVLLISLFLLIQYATTEKSSHLFLAHDTSSWPESAGF
jgi:hypothetical protein